MLWSTMTEKPVKITVRRKRKSSTWWNFYKTFDLKCAANHQDSATNGAKAATNTNSNPATITSPETVTVNTDLKQQRTSSKKFATAKFLEKDTPQSSLNQSVTSTGSINLNTSTTSCGTQNWFQYKVAQSPTFDNFKITARPIRKAISKPKMPEGDQRQHKTQNATNISAGVTKLKKKQEIDFANSVLIFPLVTSTEPTQESMQTRPLSNPTLPKLEMDETSTLSQFCGISAHPTPCESPVGNKFYNLPIKQEIVEDKSTSCFESLPIKKEQDSKGSLQSGIETPNVDQNFEVINRRSSISNNEDSELRTEYNQTRDENSQHSANVLKSLYEMQKHGQMCDLRIRVPIILNGNNQKKRYHIIRIHKNIFAIHSKKLHNAVIDLSSCRTTIKSVRRVVEYMYTGVIQGVKKLKPKAVMYVYEASLALGVYGCMQYLEIKRPQIRNLTLLTCPN